ncbi:MAG TPA: hypothetical protein VFJ02_20465, partial [Vicinamibacterales bacterium]|nr:hypothetical protein [Vicinamibacterales bacterium]
MELLERYLQAVRFFLPRRQQDDIVRELSENLRSQIEDREEELGRTLTEAEEAEILRRHGHPMIVAGRYRSNQHLIGPAFFPIYVFALKAGLAIALLVTVVLSAVSAVLTGAALDQALGAVRAYPARALMVFACTTMVFAVLDAGQSRLKLSHAWDPRTLPKLVTHEHRLPRLESLFEFILTVGAFVWLLLIPGSPWLIMGPAAAFLDAAPIWRAVYVPMLVLTGITAALNLTNFLRPYWTPARSLTRAGVHAGSLAVFTVMLRSGPWLTAKPGVTLPDGSRIVEL